MTQILATFKPARDFTSVIDRAVEEALREILGKIIARVRNDIPPEIERRIVGAPEYIALLSGRFRGEIGVVNPAPVIRAMVGILQKEMEIEIEPVKVRAGSVKGGFRVSVVRANLAPLFNLPGAIFRSENGYDVPWLEWLLTAGDRIVIADYHFSPIPSERSRTGEGLMNKGGSWHVPSAYAGTTEDNWLIRALSGLEEYVDKLLAEYLRG